MLIQQYIKLQSRIMNIMNMISLVYVSLHYNYPGAFRPFLKIDLQ